MSIPPLVCSTPPPPEQCEDDKDQEDFELDYNSSQEEDEANNYDYGSFTTYNHFQSATSKNSQEYNITQEKSKDTTCDKTIIETNSEINIKVDSELPLEDDIIEDLNLKIDHEQKSNNEETETSISEKTVKLIKDSQPDIPVNNVDNTIDQDVLDSKNVDVELSNVENVKDSSTSNINEKVPGDFITDKSDNCTESDLNMDDEIVYSNIKSDIVAETTEPEKNRLVENIELNSYENNDLDDFEDFEDFQFVSSENKSPEIVLDTTSENPWQNDVPKDEGFGQFTANFVEDIKQTQNPIVMTPPNSSNHQVQDVQDSDDDFGDFDEFKSVNNMHVSETNPEHSNDVPVLSLQSSDSEHQIIEQINKVMQTIFQEEITDCDSVAESKFESSLGETWGYLRETDVRQPYIVNWNNSLAQKTLLKALCIDSRNILFGPKWSSSTPKYAAALSTAPLQPQKQAGQTSVSQNENINSEKAMNKTWADPFTANGQEFTYAEALLLDLEHLMATLDQMAHNHSTLKISELLSHACNTGRENTVIETGPTDLDVFEAARSSKPDKIFSSTLSIQPMRHINLPDTHIFTPTNSEIPRSKTIHYDNTTAQGIVLLQTVADNLSTQTLHQENDNDYWDFQDFRGAAHNKVVVDSTVNEELKVENKDNTESEEATKKSSLTFAAQVLQPIKLEPIMPTLNWPDPGEVKETFDDFSDFISNSPVVNDRQESTLQSIKCDIKYNCKNADDKDSDEKISNSKDKIDDDFEVFQSALPSLKHKIHNEFTNQNYVTKDEASSSKGAPITMSDFDVVFSKVEKSKSENISVNTRPIENVIKSNDNNTSSLKSPSLPSNARQMANTVLQPTLATLALSKQSQPKMGQILQPLSLESYSQINWPNPGIDLQDLSRFNPVETLQSLKNDSNSKTASPVHSHKSFGNNNHTSDEDIWGEFVSSKPKQQHAATKKQTTIADDEEWTEFVSSPSVNPQNGLNTISLNVHTNSNMQKSSNSSKYPLKSNEISLDIPSLNYITPKSNKAYNEKHFQNL